MKPHAAIHAARRPAAFLTVAFGGFLLQTGTVGLLTLLHVPAEAATAIGVELAVLHNFLWHERWTWRDRAADLSRLRRLAAYQLATGSISLAGNLVVVATAVRAFGVDPVAANVLAVVSLSVANYAIADRWIFARRAGVTGVVVATLWAAPAAAQPAPETIRAWDAHIATIESARRQGRLPAAEPGEPQGRDLRVPGGLVHEWSGSVVIPGVSVQTLVDALTNPGTPPPQDDVLEARVLAKTGDTLRVYLKLRRSAIVTVTYDTEHEVVFERSSPSAVTSRSVATSIREAGGGDRGFLWRMNSYWTYRQVDGGVRVDAFSVSLSRDVPLLARPIVSPVAGRVARESMRRTLDAMRQFGLTLSRQRA
jgi:putative flippase GtrA